MDLILKKQIVVKTDERESSYTYRLLKTWAEIDLAALRSNIRHLRKKIPPDIGIMAVVKCNAYGHGAVEVSKEAIALGVEALGISSLFEGIELREEFPEIPIVVLSAGTSGQSDEFLQHDLSTVVCSWETVNSLAETAEKRGTRAKVHIKIDTGMGRIGVWHARADEFIRKVYQNPNIMVEGVCSHFATSDEEDLSFSLKQLEWFSTLLKKINDLPIPFKHISNTAGIFNLPHSYFNMVRPGASIYGVQPTEFILDFDQIKPVLSLKTKIAFIKKIPPGRTLSYGRTYRTRNEMTVATLPVGYGDGYPRFLSNKGHVLIRGQKAGILGTVTMDQIMVDISCIPNVHVDDVAVLIGKQGKDKITAADIARLGGTIPYDIFTSINKRVQRVYLS
ncbi:MAG: alanine racemase [Deltaproteobacteria bacterium]|nr:alanine racemase [Deltaproteobacteria bacterium]